MHSDTLVQPGRYVVQEDFGCNIITTISWLDLLFVQLWRAVCPLISAFVYCRKCQRSARPLCAYFKTPSSYYLEVLSPPKGRERVASPRNSHESQQIFPSARCRCSRYLVYVSNRRDQHSLLHSHISRLKHIVLPWLGYSTRVYDEGFHFPGISVALKRSRSGLILLSPLDISSAIGLRLCPIWPDCGSAFNVPSLALDYHE